MPGSPTALPFAPKRLRQERRSIASSPCFSGLSFLLLSGCGYRLWCSRGGGVLAIKWLKHAGRSHFDLDVLRVLICRARVVVDYGADPTTDQDIAEHRSFSVRY